MQELAVLIRHRIVCSTLYDERRLTQILDNLQCVGSAKMLFLKRTETGFDNRTGIFVVLDNARQRTKWRDPHRAGEAVVLCRGNESHRSTGRLAHRPYFFY